VEFGFPFEQSSLFDSVGFRDIAGFGDLGGCRCDRRRLDALASGLPFGWHTRLEASAATTLGVAGWPIVPPIPRPAPSGRPSSNQASAPGMDNKLTTKSQVVSGKLRPSAESVAMRSRIAQNHSAKNTRRRRDRWEQSRQSSATREHTQPPRTSHPNQLGSMDRAGTQRGT